MTWLRRLRCVLGGGHLPITKSGGGEVYRSCFRCEARIGTGWSQQGLTPPTRTQQTRRLAMPHRTPRRGREWWDRHEKGA